MPKSHFNGTLQADAYAGFNRLYDNGYVKEAACWAHVRRKFFDIEQASVITRKPANADGSGLLSL